MKKLSLLFLCLLLLSACSSDISPTESPLSQHKDGHLDELRLAQFKGQWLVVNYWAKWCKPCIKEIPELNELNERYPEVTVLGVNFDGANGDELATQLSLFGVKFTTLLKDPSLDLNVSRPLVLPTTIIIDPSGTISQTLIGPQTLATLVEATNQNLSP